MERAFLSAVFGATAGVLAPAAVGAAGAAGTAASTAATAAPVATDAAGGLLSKAALDGTMAFGANSVPGALALPSSGGGLMGAMSQYGKPAAQMAQGLMGSDQQQPTQPQQVQQAGGGAQMLAAL